MTALTTTDTPAWYQPHAISIQNQFKAIDKRFDELVRESELTVIATKNLLVTASRHEARLSALETA